MTLGKYFDDLVNQILIHPYGDCHPWKHRMASALLWLVKSQSITPLVPNGLRSFWNNRSCQGRQSKQIGSKLLCLSISTLFFSHECSTKVHARIFCYLLERNNLVVNLHELVFYGVTCEIDVYKFSVSLSLKRFIEIERPSCQ